MFSSHNDTTAAAIPLLTEHHPLFHAHPIYHSSSPSLLPSLSDPLLAVLAPVPAYWLTAAFFQLLDLSNAPWLLRYRIHDSAEVFRAVIVQQVLQTALAVWWVSEPEGRVDHVAAVRSMARIIASFPFFGSLENTAAVAAPLAYLLYWWVIPTVRMLLAMVVLDTWQYFLHRLMHLNRFLYKHLHSVHHRLYVPYAYGALYNHPIEGFVLDTLGALLTETVTGLSVRQAMLFFVLSTCKTVDDHCGYSLPFDPLQMLSGNTADYHDIHHQAIGIKSNFSQPWFVHWDVILGTRMTRQDIEERRAKVKKS
ncbi:fatty acid hydroxylase superfamily-domain-containing protein [Russula vinacea]|nr:fatty acid hydroxylase superfamily-domain-containing protein [Russula vinacea]